MTNSMPLFIYASLNPNEYNFRVWRQSINDVVRGTDCEINNHFFGAGQSYGNMIRQYNKY